MEGNSVNFVVGDLDCFKEEVVTECEQTPNETGVQTDPIKVTCECSLPQCECSCHRDKPAHPKELKIHVNDFDDDPEGLKYYPGCDSLTHYLDFLMSHTPSNGWYDNMCETEAT